MLTSSSEMAVSAPIQRQRLRLLHDALDDLLYRTGEDGDPAAIVNSWNAQGIPTAWGNAWGPSVLGRLLRAERIAGMGRHRDHVFVGDWEPIIDTSTFYALAEALGECCAFEKTDGRRCFGYNRDGSLNAQEAELLREAAGASFRRPVVREPYVIGRSVYYPEGSSPRLSVYLRRAIAEHDRVFAGCRRRCAPHQALHRCSPELGGDADPPSNGNDAPGHELAPTAWGPAGARARATSILKYSY